MHKALMLIALIHLPSLVIAKNDLKVPAALSLPDGAVVNYHRTVEIKCAFDFEKLEDQKKGHLDNKISMEIDYRLTWKSNDKGYKLVMTITNAKLVWNIEVTGKKKANKSWSYPKNASAIVMEFDANSRGQITGYSGKSLRTLFAQRGCPRKLAKIPSVYLLSRTKEFRDFGGAHAYPWVLPKESAQSWDIDQYNVLGITDGLLDDFSGFHEKWRWGVTSIDKDNAVLNHKLEGFSKFKENSRNINNIKINDTKGKAVISTKTGQLKSLDTMFEVSYEFDEEESHKGAGSFKYKTTVKIKE